MSESVEARGETLSVVKPSPDDLLGYGKKIDDASYAWRTSTFSKVLEYIADNISGYNITDEDIEDGYNNRVLEATTEEAEGGVVEEIRRWSPKRIYEAVSSITTSFPANVVVADSSARNSTVPEALTQYLYQTDTAAWYTPLSLSAGSWGLVTSWIVGGNYSSGDIRSSFGLLWECIEAHTAPAWGEPGVGAGYQRYWKPWLVQGFHWDYAQSSVGARAAKHIIFGSGSLFPDWSFAFNYILAVAIPWNGGGSNNAAWLDKTPLANPAAWPTGGGTFAAGDFCYRSSVRYKCHTGHTTTGTGAADAPGTGANWEDYWIVWTQDPRVNGVVEFSSGTYYFSQPMHVPPSVTLYSRASPAEQRSMLVAKTGFAGTYLYEGVFRNGTNSNANFFTSVIGLTLNPQKLCKAAYWPCSHGSIFDAEIVKQGYYTPLTIGKNSDDFVCKARITDTAEPFARSPYGIFVENGVIACTFSNCVIGQAGVGISFADVEGCTIIGLETESVAKVIEVRLSVHSTYYATAWATATAYKIGDRRNDGAGGYYRCFNDHTSGASTQPGVGVDAWKYWVRRNDETQGRCGGLNIIGGRWYLAAGDTNDAVISLRYQTGIAGAYHSCNISGVFLDVSSALPTWRFIELQENGTPPDDIYFIPIRARIGTGPVNTVKYMLDHGERKVPLDFSLNDTFLKNRHMLGAVGGGAVASAKEQSTRWVTLNNPATFTTDSNVNVAMEMGYYELEIVFNSGTGTITIDDPNGNPLPGFVAFTASAVRRFHHSGGTLNVELSGSAATPSMDVFFKPLPL